ncbi:MAG: hypothetical protein IKT52_08475 [Oscillospiraceae bacterium]|nr:hypothetical protein [Oscillospiraceae bacterium]
MIVFAVMYLILGMYFAFVTSEYANHPGFAATIKAHRNMDQIFAIVCFALFVVGLRCFYGLMKQKKIPALYYVYMAISAVLPILYIAMSDNFITDAMVSILEEGYPEFLEGEDGGWMVYWIGVEFGAWANGGEITFDSEIVVDYLSRIGHEPGVWVDFADFNLSGLLAEFRADMNTWNKFEVYSIVNASLSVVFVVCGIFFLPLKKSKLFQK